MAKDSPSIIGNLRRRVIITDMEIKVAVHAYLTDHKTPPYRFRSGHVVDVGAAVAAHRPSHGALSMPGISDTFRRTVIYTAVIMAVPVLK